MDRKGCTVIGRRYTECLMEVKMPEILRIDKATWTNKVRACHVSKLLVLTTSIQDIQ